MASRADLVFKLVSLIPKGKVATYKSVAEVCGIKSPRLVGSFLHLNKDSRGVPCHRVLRANGSLAAGYAFGGKRGQKSKLVSESVAFIGDRIDQSRHFWQPSKLTGIFLNLWEDFGEPGPWPWFDYGKVSNRDEIAIGAILTAHTRWRNVEYALSNLRRAGICSLSGILALGTQDMEKLNQLVRPSGFYRQKTERLVLLAKFIISKYSSPNNFLKLSLPEARRRLLSLRGIGPETADTILLYALNKPVFVIDAYTRRLSEHYKLSQDFEYEALRKLFERNLPQNVGLYQDFHALIVRWGKTRSLVTK